MHIEWGKEMFGKVDAVPGCFHVATEFFHINRLPLVPGRTYLMLKRPWGDERGPELPFSRKSLVTAWARATLIGWGIGVAVAIVILWKKPGLPTPTAEITTLIALAVVLYATYRIPRLGVATYARAVEVSDAAELDDEMLVRVELAFKRISRADADAILAQLRPAGPDPAEDLEPED